MKDIDSVESLKPSESLMSHSPNEVFINETAVGLISCDELEDIPSLKALSDDAEAIRELIEEGIAVGEDVWAS